MNECKLCGIQWIPGPPHCPMCEMKKELARLKKFEPKKRVVVPPPPLANDES